MINLANKLQDMLPKKSLIYSIAVLLLSPVSIIAQEANDEAYLDSIVSICGKQVGVYIEDLRTGQVICDLNGEKLFTPASVTKIVTTASLLSSVNPGSNFNTNVKYSGTISADSTLKGDIVIFPSGDPTLESWVLTVN